MLEGDWVESHQLHDRRRLRQFSTVMLDVYFQFGFMHILVIKEGKRRSILRAGTSAVPRGSGRGRHWNLPWWNFVLAGRSKGVLKGLILLFLSPVVLALPVR